MLMRRDRHRWNRAGRRMEATEHVVEEGWVSHMFGVSGMS